MAEYVNGRTKKTKFKKYLSKCTLHKIKRDTQNMMHKRKLKDEDEKAKSNAKVATRRNADKTLAAAWARGKRRTVATKQRSRGRL